MIDILFQLADWLNAKITEFSDKNLPVDLNELRNALADFFGYKNNDKPEKAAEKLALESLFNSIAMKLKTNNRSPFVPAEGTAPSVSILIYFKFFN